jgi:hypothetical protein
MKLEINHVVTLKFVFVLCLVISGYSSCTYKNEEEVNPSGTCSGVSLDSVSFSNDIIPIFVANCDNSGCHTGNTQASNILNLSPSVAYSQLSKKGSGYINVSNPSFSVLYSTLVSGSPAMPPSGPLSNCELELIQKWMSQGGKNN